MVPRIQANAAAEFAGAGELPGILAVEQLQQLRTYAKPVLTWGNEIYKIRLLPVLAEQSYQLHNHKLG